MTCDPKPKRLTDADYIALGWTYVPDPFGGPEPVLAPGAEVAAAERHTGYEGRLAGTATPEEVLAAARAAGLPGPSF